MLWVPKSFILLFHSENVKDFWFWFWGRFGCLGTVLNKKISLFSEIGRANLTSSNKNKIRWI